MNQVELLLFAILIVCGYLTVYQMIAASCRNRRILPAVAVVTLVLYTCFVGGVILLYFYSGNDPFVVFGSLVLFALFGFITLLRFCLKIRHQLQPMPLVLFLLYLAALLAVTLLMRIGTVRNDIQMEPFHQIKEALNTQNWKIAEHNYQNVILFIPMGFLIPFINPHHFRRFSYSFLIAVMISTFIETTQYLFQLGTCDIDDIIANTFGAIIGFAAARICLSFIHNRDK